MSTSVRLQDELKDEDLTWLFQTGVEKTVPSGHSIIHEGARPNAIFVVIRGQFSVRLENLAGGPLAKLGAGELIGEISFLEGSPASATVSADEESTVLEIENRELNRRIGEDTGFAARMYRAFALVAERRLRDRVDHLAFRFESAAGPRSQRDFCVPALS